MTQGASTPEDGVLGPCGDEVYDQERDVRFPEVAVQLTGEDGNAFSIIGRVQQALTRAGHPVEAGQFAAAAMGCQSYDEVLQLTLRTVEVQ